MNILRVADEKSIPWFKTEEEKSNAPIEEVEQINIAKEVDDFVLAQECDRIETCSSNGKLYHYNSNWDNGTISHLKEYAIACGMDLSKFKGFNPSDIQKESASGAIIKTAQTNSEDTDLQDLWKDPFRIDERSDTSYMDETNWQEVKKQSVLGEPSVDMGNVLALRGGENYFINSDVSPAPNQNSITNPDAIGQLANSKVMDTGERLKKEQVDKQAQKELDHSEWQQAKIDEMSSGDIIPKGTVFPTETLNANTGLDNPSSQMGVYAKFDPDSIPDKTAGEQIADKNKQYKETIQRPKTEDDWQKPSKQTSRGISDSFADSLATNLGKIKK